MRKRGIARHEGGEHEHRTSLAVMGDVVDPGVVGLVEDDVRGGRRDRCRERADRCPVGLSQRAVAIRRVVDVDVGRLVGVRVGERDVNRALAVAVVLDVRPAGGGDEPAHRRPVLAAVGLGREVWVVVAAAPEQVRAALGGEVDRVRVSEAAPAGVFSGIVTAGPQARDVLGRERGAVPHRRARVRRVVRAHTPVGQHLDRRVGVIVDLHGRGHDRRRLGQRVVIVGRHLHVAVACDPAHVRAPMGPLVVDGARVGEPRPRAVAQRHLFGRDRPAHDDRLALVARGVTGDDPQHVVAVRERR